MRRQRKRNVFVRFFEYMESLPWAWRDTLYVRFPRLGVNREQPTEELRKSRVPEDIQQAAIDRMRGRRIEGRDD